ncbi:MAG TPA: PilZ domain-containing protein [bacterium]
MNDIVEKRKFNRFEFQKSVLVFPVIPSESGNIYQVQNKSYESWAHDISEDGLQLENLGNFNSDTILKLRFELEANTPVEVYGKVIWSESDHLGLRFVLPDSKVRKGIQAISQKK